MKATLDTNIVISRYLTPNGPPGQVFEAARATQFEMVVSGVLLEEYRKSFLKPRLVALHQMTEREIANVVTEIEEFSVFAVPVPPFATEAPDPKDNMVLDCAIAGNADYIVTGDKGLLQLEEYRGIRIITAIEFLAILDGLNQTRENTTNAPLVE